MHLRRWITSIVALPLLIGLIWKGSPSLFAAFIGIVCILCLWEYCRIVFEDDQGNMAAKEIPLVSFITGPLIIWAAHGNRFDVMMVIISLNLIISGLLSLPRFKSNNAVVDIIARQILCIIYIPLFLSCLVMIRNGTSGIHWIFFLLCIIFSSDTGAYYAGSYLGRHKLCPAVSPGKTVEGAVGGLIASFFVGSLFKFLFLPALPWGVSFIIFPVVCIAGQVGDLFESELKRVAKVKDSGTIFPGHGGMLDRIDALLFAAPVVYFFKVVILAGG